MKTMRELLGEYMDHRRGLNYSPRSIEEYGYDCGGFLRHVGERFGVTAALSCGNSIFSVIRSRFPEGKTRRGCRSWPGA